MPHRPATDEPWARPITLKDGRAALVRPVKVDDAASVLRCAKAVLEAGEGVVRSPNQLAPTPEEMTQSLREWTDGTRNGTRGTMLVCELAPEIIGEATIHRMSPSRLRPVAPVSVEVHPNLQRLGVGRPPMNAQMHWARGPDGAGLLRIDLADAVYVLHCFQKKTEQTSDKDIELARRRYKELMRMQP